jgi:site-specific DNA recombinase
MSATNQQKTNAALSVAPVVEPGANAPIRAGILSRVSTTMQAERVSLEQQEDAGRRKAEALSREFERSVEVVKVYRGAGISGDGEERPELTAALNDIKAGAVDLLIAYDVDRITRDVPQLLDVYGTVSDYGGRIELVQSPLRWNEKENAVDEDDSLMLLIRGWLAQKERTTILRRTDNGRMGLLAKQIQTQRGHDPYGYHIPRHWEAKAGRCRPEEVGRYFLVESQAKIVTQIYEKVCEGRFSIREIARWLQDDLCIPAPKGGVTWYPSTIREMIADPLYMGKARYGVRKNVRPRGAALAERQRRGLKRCHMVPTDPEAWIYLDAPATVTPEIWEKANAVLAGNKENKSGAPTNRRLLSSFLRCPECGGSLVGRSGGGGGSGRGASRILTYGCSKNEDNRLQAKRREASETFAPCPWKNHVRASLIEERFFAALTALLETPAVIEAAVRAYVAAAAERASTGSAAEERAELTTSRAATQKRAAALQQAIVLALEDGADTASLRQQQKDTALLIASLDRRLAALPEAGKIADALPSPAEVRAAVTERIRDLPAMLRETALTIKEKRWLIESAVESIAVEMGGPRAHNAAIQDYACIVKLRPEVWGMDTACTAGAIGAIGAMRVMSAEKARSVGVIHMTGTDRTENTAAFYIRSTVEGVTCYVA